MNTDPEKLILPINKDKDSEISEPFLLQSLKNTENRVTEIKKSPNQLKALFLKSCSLQFKQIGTNICQILTPLICLSIVLIIKQVTSGLFSGKTYTMPVPMPFNLPTINNYFEWDGFPFKLETCLQWYNYDFYPEASNETIDFVGFNSGRTTENGNGLLGNTMNNLTCYYRPWSNAHIMNVSNVPFFQKPSNGRNLNEDIFNNILLLNTQPLEPHVDVPHLNLLPDGAVRFKEASPQKLSYTLLINDLRIPEYHRDNGITKIYFQDKNGDYNSPVLIVSDGQLSLMDLINKAYLNTIDPQHWIMSGVQYMPTKDQNQSWLMKIINLAGASLFPLSLSLLLPVFMYAIVLEKEERLLEMMKMNGMRMRNYWSVTYLFNFSMYFLMIAIFFIFGFLFLELSFFTETHPGLLVLTMIGWGLSQVSLALFFQVFISKARTSTIVGYLLSIWTIIIAVSLNVAVYPDPYTLPLVLRLYPPFAFCRIMYLLCNACSNNLCYKTFDVIPEEINSCFWVLYFGALIFLVLGIYLHEVVPQEYGIRKHPLFFLPFFGNGDKNISSQEAAEDESEFEDIDSKNERKFVNSINNVAEYPLICKNLQKIYRSSGGRPVNKAVNNFSLAIRHGEIFGLLGPNGAGKTTLIAMLTGLYPPNSGNAWVGGFSIRNQINQVHLQMGVCPQFDLLWPDLTVEEHLIFYARLKGITRKDEKFRVNEAMKEVFLEKFEGFKAQALSGGMKRRLSVAIALVGDPKIIFLDEPTTGLDPENRRQLWDILVESRGKRAMVLTTHSMEEADVLCSRVGIINEGVLRTVGPQVRLKSLYGGGYHLYVNCHKERFIRQQDGKKEIGYYHKRILEFLNFLAPKALLITEFNGNFVFQVPLEGTKVWRLFEELESGKKDLMISDWGISQSSLEDVFMKIVN